MCIRDRWSYTTERGVRHVGPMAQDFYAAFNVGEDNRHITSIDEDGVALAAIEALDAKLARKDAEIQSLPICSGRSPLQFASCDLGGSQCLSLRVRLGQWRSRRAWFGQRYRRLL